MICQWKTAVISSDAHLDSERESRWVERVFSVQLTAHRQGAADVVQGKNAVGVSWMDNVCVREREREWERDMVSGTNVIDKTDNSTALCTVKLGF